MNKILLVLLILISFNLYAQDKEDNKKYDPQNWFLGGSMSLGFGGGYYSSFQVGIHPHYGYTLASWIDAAAVANFEYSSSKDEYSNRYHNTIYGLGLFTRIYPVKFLFLQIEPEYNFIASKFIPGAGSSAKQTVSAPSLLLGAGYVTSRSDKNSFTYLSVLFDVLNDVNSPYTSQNNTPIPLIRAGINIGLNRKHKD